MGAALDREGLSLSISSEHGSCPRARSTCHAPWPGLQRYSLDHLIVALEEVGPALRAQVERGLHVLVNVHVGHVVIRCSSQAHRASSTNSGDTVTGFFSCFLGCLSPVETGRGLSLSHMPWPPLPQGLSLT